MIKYADIRPCVDHLIAVCPPPKGTILKVEVLSKDELEGSDGCCFKSRNVFKIQIADSLCPTCAEETLLHEYAHVINWRPHHPITGDHDEFWGVAYAKVRRLYHGEC